MKKLGLIINPIAGMGGSVGLKGTDGCLEEARRRGALPKSNERTKKALEELEPIREELLVYTAGGDMGGSAAQELGFRTVILRDEGDDTTQEDTLELARVLKEEGVDLILFAGGDGTARNIYQALGTDVTVLGIPSGVKIHSPVYAISPKMAGRLALLFLKGEIRSTKDEEVLDIDEEEYRRGRIYTKLYGYLKLPVEKRYTQNRKAPSPLSELANADAIAHQIIEDMEEDTYYLIGAGTTTAGIMHYLDLQNTLIGVDLIYNRKLIENDVYGEKIIERIKGRRTKLIVTVTGGQGFLFGRGNQQLTPEVLREVGRENIVIVATKMKLAELQGAPLRIDTDDEELNRELSGYYKAVVGYREYTACKVSTD